MKKVAISLPEDVVRSVDEAAEEVGLSRSAFVASVLRRLAGARSDAAITRRLDEAFAHPRVAAPQIAEAKAYLTRRPRSGWEW